MTLVETLIDHNDSHNVTLSNKKLRQAVSIVMEKMEEEAPDAERNANNVTMDNLIQFPVMINTPRKKAKFPNERQIYSDILAETIKGFKGLTLETTINDSAYYHSDKNDAESNPKKAIHW